MCNKISGVMLLLCLIKKRCHPQDGNNGEKGLYEKDNIYKNGKRNKQQYYDH